MKKQMLIVLLMMMIPFLALSQAPEEIPQTRREVIHLEGMEETIVTTYFASPRGYSMWIDTDFLAFQPEDEGNDIDVFLRPGDEDRRYQVSINYWGGLDYSFDLAAESARENLLMNYHNAEDVEAEGVLNGLQACGFYATDSNRTILQYVVDAGDGAYFITITFPQEAAEGYGARVEQMLQSFEIHALE